VAAPLAPGLLGAVLTALATPTLRTARLVLRPFDEADGEDLWALQSDAEVLRYWDAPPWTDRARVEVFLARSRAMAEEGTGVRLVLESDSGAFLGWCALNAWNPTYRSASITYCLARTAWGQGYATEAGRGLLGWAFAALDLNRVQAEADTRNAASRRVLEKLGFTLEGTLREDCVVDGVVSDSWVFGLLRREWSGG
jgi:[ribosomal protein S5]-alanine N-acetyltransferase